MCIAKHAIVKHVIVKVRNSYQKSTIAEAVQINEEKDEMEKPHFLARDPRSWFWSLWDLIWHMPLYTEAEMSRPPRGKPPIEEAAYYTLRGQIQMLSQKEELMAFAFEDRKKSGNTEPILFLV
ncbi:MAG: hypothetical protein ACLTZM_06175 [Ruminococcus sp.]